MCRIQVQRSQFYVCTIILLFFLHDLLAKAQQTHVVVKAKAFPIALFIEGAIVCPNDDLINIMTDLYADYSSDLIAERASRGQSTLIHGSPKEPNLKSYGCALIPPGTPMILDNTNIVPIVTVKLKDGTTIKGVTRGYMYATEQQIKDFENQRKQANADTNKQDQNQENKQLVAVQPNIKLPDSPNMPNFSGGVYQIGGDISKPQVISSVDPEFTDDARRAKFQGVVLVGLIVDALGNPQNVHVVRGIGYGLNEKAIEAVKQYKFRPAIKQGNGPVAVQLSIYVNFRIY